MYKIFWKYKERSEINASQLFLKKLQTGGDNNNDNRQILCYKNIFYKINSAAKNADMLRTEFYQKMPACRR